MFNIYSFSPKFFHSNSCSGIDWWIPVHCPSLDFSTVAQGAIFLQEFLGTDSTTEHFIFGQPAAVTAVLSVNIQCTSEEPEVSRASGLTRPESWHNAKPSIKVKLHSTVLNIQWRRQTSTHFDGARHTVVSDADHVLCSCTVMPRNRESYPRVYFTTTWSCTTVPSNHGTFLNVKTDVGHSARQNWS